MMRRRIWAAAVAAAALSACSGNCRQPDGQSSQDAKPGQPPAGGTAAADGSYLVTLRFDGGYAFIRNESDQSLTVASFHVKGEPNSFIASHQLHMRLEWGNRERGPAPDSLENTWALDKQSYDILVADYEDNPPGVTFPAERGIDPSDPCKPIAEFSDEANNLSLMPIMDQIAQKAGFDGTLDTTRSKYHNRVIVKSGTMRIVRTTSCFEFMKGSDTFGKQRIPNGLAGVTTTFRLKGNLKLNITDEKGTTTPYEFSPAVDQATGERKVDIWFGRFPPECKIGEPGCVVLKDEELVDFDRYYELLKMPLKRESRVVLVNRSETGDVTPRSQCGGIWFNVK